MLCRRPRGRSGCAHPPPPCSVQVLSRPCAHTYLQSLVEGRLQPALTAANNSRPEVIAKLEAAGGAVTQLLAADARLQLLAAGAWGQRAARAAQPSLEGQLHLLEEEEGLLPGQLTVEDIVIQGECVSLCQVGRGFYVAAACQHQHTGMLACCCWLALVPLRARPWCMHVETRRTVPPACSAVYASSSAAEEREDHLL